MVFCFTMVELVVVSEHHKGIGAKRKVLTHCPVHTRLLLGGLHQCCPQWIQSASPTHEVSHRCSLQLPMARWTS